MRLPLPARPRSQPTCSPGCERFAPSLACLVPRFSPGESKHPVFGKCVDKASFDMMVKISKVPTRDDCPNTPVQMKSVTIA